MTTHAIQTFGLSKRYELGETERYRTLRDSLSARIRGLIPLGASRPRSARGELWALVDVTFTAEPGEVIGVIGRNGAGKSTLLKILARITEPTEGHALIRGRVGSLLEVGTGFHPELTGRENIFLSGVTLGMSRSEIRESFDEIVEFAEISEFLDTPVKRYSSGMFMRLAFAVAAHLRTEIMLIDEVLAVGDAAFQRKCIGKIDEVAHSGRTVLFVSHNMAALSALCSRALLMHSGMILLDDAVNECIRQYSQNDELRGGLEWRRPESDTFRPLSIEYVGGALEGDQPAHRLALDIELESWESHRPALLAADILPTGGGAIMQALPDLSAFIRSDRRTHRLRMTVELPPLIPGRYSVSVWVGSHYTETYHFATHCVDFEIHHSPTNGRTFPHAPSHGYVVPHSRVEYVET